jgi:antitoxin component YwqK of YwqJK toxin-antitoxin module
LFLSFVAIASVSCQTGFNGSVLSERYIHKYGFPLSAQEWRDRTEDGQIITFLKDGVKVTKTYENGKLHGPTTYTYPHSDIIHRSQIYDVDLLLKETVFDAKGLPLREEAFEFDDRKIITVWSPKGAPLSVEAYEGSHLLEGQYYDWEHTLEAEVVDGVGFRTQRESSGLLLLKDRIEQGQIALRTTYHPNGQVHTISHYTEGLLDGEQLKYTSSGRPFMQMHWHLGVLDGLKTSFRNGSKVAEVPYVAGMKEGVEQHFDDLGNLVSEIQWRGDQKHGFHKIYSEEETEVSWFYRGNHVSQDKFDTLERRDAVIADFEMDAAQIESCVEE